MCHRPSHALVIACLFVSVGIWKFRRQSTPLSQSSSPPCLFSLLLFLGHPRIPQRSRSLHETERMITVMDDSCNSTDNKPFVPTACALPTAHGRPLPHPYSCPSHESSRRQLLSSSRVSIHRLLHHAHRHLRSRRPQHRHLRSRPRHPRPPLSYRHHRPRWSPPHRRFDRQG